MEDLAKTAARAKAMGGTVAGSPKAAHMATTAYGLHAVRKPMQTATESWKTQKYWACKQRRMCVILKDKQGHLPSQLVHVHW